MLGYQPPTQNPTIGCHCSEIHVTVEGKATTLQVWDTAGQEMYRALVPVYLRGAQVVILAYDITDRESFKSINHWYEILIDVVPAGTPIFLVGNKIDLEKDAIVDDQSASTFAQSHGSQLFKVSAMAGQGLDGLFQAIASKRGDRFLRNTLSSAKNASSLLMMQRTTLTCNLKSVFALWKVKQNFPVKTEILIRYLEKSIRNGCDAMVYYNRMLIEAKMEILNNCPINENPEIPFLH